MPEPATFAGLTSPAARAAMVFVWATGLVHTVLLWDDYTHPLLVAVGLVVTLVGIVALTGPRGQVPLPAAAVVAAAPVVNAAVLIPQLAEPADNRVWLLEIGAYLTGLLAVRGRMAVASCGTGVLVLAVIVWGVVKGVEVRAVATILALPVSAIAVGAIWSFLLRRTLEQVTAHRRAGAAAVRDRLAAEAATAASRAELGVIAATVRPLLADIALGRPSDAADLDGYRVAEARVRDRLRARTLAVHPLAPACTRARLRGVDVLLLDDGSPDAPALRDELIARLVAMVDEASRGSMTIRVMPPGRAGHVSVLLDDGDDTALTVLDIDGSRVRTGVGPANPE